MVRLATLYLRTRVRTSLGLAPSMEHVGRRVRLHPIVPSEDPRLIAIRDLPLSLVVAILLGVFVAGMIAGALARFP